MTETALTTALNTSYMAEQLALFGIVVGVALLLSGIGFGILAIGGALRNPESVLTASAASTRQTRRKGRAERLSSHPRNGTPEGRASGPPAVRPRAGRARARSARARHGSTAAASA